MSALAVLTSNPSGTQKTPDDAVTQPALSSFSAADREDHRPNGTGSLAVLSRCVQLQPHSHQYSMELLMHTRFGISMSIPDSHGVIILPNPDHPVHSGNLIGATGQLRGAGLPVLAVDERGPRNRREISTVSGATEEPHQHRIRNLPTESHWWLPIHDCFCRPRNVLACRRIRISVSAKHSS
jgi:hypothetical protein